MIRSALSRKMFAVRSALPFGLLAVLAGAPLARAGEAAPAPAAPVKAKAVPAVAPAGVRLVAASVAASRHAVLSTRIAASVRAVHVEEGQRVEAGQLLVSLADDDVRGGLAAAETGLAAAAAYERRVKALSAERAATPAELEMAQAERAKAEAAVAGARATLGYTEIRAPYAGVIQARRVDPGSLVGPGQPLVELEGDGLELVASLSEAEAAGLAVGQPVAFQAEGLRGGAEISALTPGGDPVSHRRSLRAKVKKAEGPVRAGAFVRMELPAATAPAGVWVPRRALVERGDLVGVFVADAGRANLRWVAIGEPAGDAVPVRAGLKQGEVVVEAAGLRDGQAIEVAR